MTAPNDGIIIEAKIVVVLDICSSSTILENVHRTQQIKEWRRVLIRLKRFLMDMQEARGFSLYKFLGDGWVLLFEPGNARDVLPTLKELCKLYCQEYNKWIDPILEEELKVRGITFGLDSGDLVRITMNETTEYIGRPINIAARLQGAIKEKDNSPGNKVLLSKKLFRELEPYLGGMKSFSVTRKLRNISGGERFRCQKLDLSKPKTDGKVERQGGK